MEDWFNQFGTQIGDRLVEMQQPFGLAPPQNMDPAQRQAMINRGLMTIASGFLQNKKNPMKGFAAGSMALQQQAGDDATKMAYLKQITDAQGDRKEKKDRENQTLEWLKKTHPNLYYPGMAGEDAAQIYQSTLKSPDMPASVDEFNYARQNGFKGSFADWKNVGNSGGNSISADVDARKKSAAELGLTPDNPAYQAYVLTGKVPREDAQRLTATDKKFVAEADDAVLAADNVSGQLKQALKLNDTTNYGAGAGVQAWAARNDPTGFFDDAKGQQTTDFSNLVGTQALNSMKSIFGANPTEGERAILLELQASVDKTPDERRPILDRALQLVERRKQFYKDRADELRGGEFYTKDGGVSGAEQSNDGWVTLPNGVRIRQK